MADASNPVTRCAHVDRTCEGARRCVLPATPERHLHVWGSVPEAEETTPWRAPAPRDEVSAKPSYGAERCLREILEELQLDDSRHDLQAKIISTLGSPDETPARRCALPVITFQMVADFGQEGFFEPCEESRGVKGIGWSQAAVDFACLIQGMPAEETNSPLSRDEIIERMRGELFSVRQQFYSLLDERASRRMDGSDEKVRLKWPYVLSVIPLDEWNLAYEQTMNAKAARAAVNGSAVTSGD